MGCEEEDNGMLGAEGVSAFPRRLGRLESGSEQVKAAYSPRSLLRLL